MLRIGICDDQESSRCKISEYCKKHFESHKDELELVEFTSGEEVLTYDGGKIQLLFLDVELGDMDGIMVMHRIQRTDLIWRVVFVTSHEEVMVDAFSTKTLGFLVKPITESNINKYILKVLQEYQNNTPVEFSVNQTIIYRNLDDIFYLEGEGNYTYLYTEKDGILLDGKVKIWQEKLQELPIIRVHKSYLVQLGHIAKWAHDKVTLDNNKIIPIGRHYADEAKRIYMDYLRKQGVREG